MEFPYPQQVFRYFTEIAAIPHGSGNTEGIRQWCLKTAAALGIEAAADSEGNVIMHAPAAEGYASHPGVILQGHLDMVCAKLPDCPKNMALEGLDLVWSADTLTANGTTLGGDDGIAVAYAFALLADRTLPHPPLTVILTADEETGMDGASGLSADALDGQYLINIDSEDEGIFTVGCAGGVRLHLNYPAETAQTSGTLITLMLSGLIGGHSGTEIAKPRLNANTAMLRLLKSVPIPIRLASFCGGVRDNVIPTECTAAFYCQPCMMESVFDAVTAARAQLCEDHPAETEMTLVIDTPVKSAGSALSAEDTAKLLDRLSALPNGVQRTDPVLHMPLTSLNLGIMALKQDGFHVDALLRSGLDAEKDALADQLRANVSQAGGTAEESGRYPAWEYQPGTVLEKTAAAVFRDMYGREPVIETIHAGLECGILAAKKPALECISIGPDLSDVHTPRETLSIPSAARTWDYLCALLKAL